MSGSPRIRAVRDVLHSCYSARGDLGILRARLLAAFGQAVPFDAAFMAVADPDTLLFTSAIADEPLLL